MPLFGAHVSIAGGFHKAVERAAAHGMATLQIFTANPNAWPSRRPAPGQPTPAGPGAAAAGSTNHRPVLAASEEEVRRFRRALRQATLRHPLAHDSYLINLASPDADLYRRSVDAFVDEVGRAERLGLAYVVAHPGAHLGDGEAAGLDRVAAALDEVHRRCPGVRIKVLLETTAGQGTTLGHRFEHLAHVLGRLAEPERVGVCLDTCHVFAAGYALAPEREYRATLREFDRLIGLDRLRAFHVNDSLRPQGSRVDRHAHIGQGHLGLEPLRLLVNDPRFRNRPMVLETPKASADNDDMDAVNLTVLRGLVRARAAR